MMKTTQGYKEKNINLQFVNNTFISLCNVMNNLKFIKMKRMAKEREYYYLFSMAYC